MTHKMHAALVASVSLVAFTFAANETFARSGAAPGAAVGAAHVRGPIAPRVGASVRHHRGNRVGAFFPGAGGFFYDPSYGSYGSYGDVPVQPPQQSSQDIRYTYTYDVPWDWAHRYPPNVTPSDRAYVTECPEQTVTVRGRDGAEQTVNIMRCY